MALVYSKVPCIVYSNHSNRFRAKFIGRFSQFLQAMPLQRRRQSIINKSNTHDGNRSLIQDEKHRLDNLKERFIGAIDQGTSSTRFIIFDATGVPVASHLREFKQIHERSGYVLRDRVVHRSETEKASRADGTSRTLRSCSARQRHASRKR